VLEQNPTESAQFWGEILKELKEKRGVEQIDLFVADGLQGLENEIAKVYPSSKTEFQKCVVHKMRNILNKTAPKDKQTVAEDLKEIFDNFDENATFKKALKKKERQTHFCERSLISHLSSNCICENPRKFKKFCNFSCSITFTRCWRTSNKIILFIIIKKRKMSNTFFLFVIFTFLQKECRFVQKKLRFLLGFLMLLQLLLKNQTHLLGLHRLLLEKLCVLLYLL
ncbi:transposase, partial [Patescibacteria group bacterium]|nr:transposase [Patescibacteria group bacterium]